MFLASCLNYSQNIGASWFLPVCSSGCCFVAPLISKVLNVSGLWYVVILGGLDFLNDAELRLSKLKTCVTSETLCSELLFGNSYTHIHTQNTVPGAV